MGFLKEIYLLLSTFSSMSICAYLNERIKKKKGVEGGFFFFWLVCFFKEKLT